MAKQTLVESNPGAGPPANFPAAIGDAGAVVMYDPLFQGSAYVAFISTRSSSFGKLAVHIPDLGEGDPVLILPEPNKPRKLTPFRFYFLRAFQHFSEVDNGGGLVRSTFDIEEARRDRKLLEHVETVLLVMDGSEMFAARCTFKTTKVNAIHVAQKTLKMAQTADWGKQGPDYQATLGIHDPRLRFTTTVTLKAGVGRASGLKYVAANGVVKPSTAGDFSVVGKYLQDAKFIQSLDRVVESWEGRRREIEGKVG